MQNYELEAIIAKHEAFIRKILGPGKRERRHPTMEEDAENERECEGTKEFRQCMLALKEQNWLINGKPVVL